MTAKEQEILLGKYVDGICTPEELEVVLNLLDESEEARKELARYLYHETTIAQAPVWGKAVIQRRPARVMPFFRYVVVPLAAAAAIMVSVYGLGMYRTGQFERGVEGRVVDVGGSVQRSSLKSQVSSREGKGLRVNDVIRVGDAVRTGVDGYVKYAYRDGSLIRLKNNTSIVLDAGGGARRFGLLLKPLYKHVRTETGIIIANVTKQAADREFRLTGRHAEALVTGTRFKIEEMQDCTRVLLWEGKMRVTGRPEEKAVELVSGQYVDVGDNKPLAVQPVGFLVYSKVGGVLFKDDFENGMKNWDSGMIMDNAETPVWDKKRTEPYCMTTREQVKDGSKSSVIVIDPMTTDEKKKVRAAIARLKVPIHAKHFVVEFDTSVDTYVKFDNDWIFVKAFDSWQQYDGRKRLATDVMGVAEVKEWGKMRQEFHRTDDPATGPRVDMKAYFNGRLVQWEAMPWDSDSLFILVYKLKAKIDNVVIRELLVEEE